MSKITELDQWATPLQEMRNWVRSGVQTVDGDFGTRWQLDWATKIGVVAAHLETGQLGAEDTWKLQALGVVLGDVIAMRTGAPWRELTDEHGTDPCLLLDAETDRVAFPMTMIAKRVQAGERLDLDRLMELVRRVEGSPSTPRKPQAAAPQSPGIGRQVARWVHKIRADRETPQP